MNQNKVQLLIKILLLNLVLVIPGVIHTNLGVGIAIAGGSTLLDYTVLFGIPFAAIAFIVMVAWLDHRKNLSNWRVFLIVALTLGPSLLLSLNYQTYGAFSMWGVAFKESIVENNKFYKAEKNIDSFLSATTISGKEICFLPNGMITWSGFIERPESNKLDSEIIFQALLGTFREKDERSSEPLLLAYGSIDPNHIPSIGWVETNITGGVGVNEPDDIWSWSGKEKTVYFDLSEGIDQNADYIASQSVETGNANQSSIVFRYFSSNGRTFEEIKRPIKEFTVPYNFIESVIRQHLDSKNGILDKACIPLTNQ